MQGVDKYFVLARLVVILGIATFLAANPLAEYQKTYAWILLLVFVLHFGILTRIFKSKDYERIKLFRVTLIFDIIFISFLVYFTGGLESNFYLLYYLAIAFASYSLGLWDSVILSFLATFTYISLNVYDLEGIFVGDLLVRLSFMWFFAAIMGSFSKNAKSSEERLHKTLDTLNQRTSELEKSQSQIETIYETSQSLSKLYEVDKIIDQVLNIVQHILGYPNFSIFLLSPDRTLLSLKGKIEGGRKLKLEEEPPSYSVIPNLETLSSKNAFWEQKTEVLTYQPQPKPKTETKEKIKVEKSLEFPIVGILEEVVKTSQPLKLTNVKPYSQELLLDVQTKAILAIPLLMQGKVFGVFYFESTKSGAFLEADQKILTILANSFSLAIENAMLHQKAEALSVSDELTGSFNYRYFTQILQEEIKRAKRYRQNLSLIMVDIDWFKKCNDSYGHLFGNLVLKDVVSIIRRCIRDVDILCRYGGEEFIVILPQTNKKDAYTIAERVRFFVQKHSFQDPGLRIKTKLTVSIGVATFPEDASDPDKLILQVDSALYQAKGKGKNLVCVV